jgi:hypothetical protein
MDTLDNYDSDEWEDVTEVEAAQKAVDAAEEALKLAKEVLEKARQAQQGSHNHYKLIEDRWQANSDELQKIDFSKWTRNQIEDYFKVLKDFYEQQIQKSSSNFRKEEGGQSIYRQWMLAPDPTKFRDRLWHHIYKHLQEIHRLLQYTDLLKPFGH